MKDSNGYVSAKLVGVIKQSPITKVVKATISFPHELQRVSTLLAHDSLTIDSETRASMSLLVRRSLILLQEHQASLVTPLDITDEIQVYRHLAKSGYASKQNNINYSK